MAEGKATRLLNKLRSMTDTGRLGQKEFLAPLNSLLTATTRARPRIKLSRSQLQNMIEKGFPWRKPFWRNFEAELFDPVLRLFPEDERIGLECGFYIGISEPMPKQTLVSGKLSVTAGITYNPEDNHFYLCNPEIAEIRFDKLPAALTGNFRAALNSFVLKRINALPVYHLEGRTSTEKALRAVLKEVLVRRDEVVLIMGLNGSDARQPKP